MTTTVQPGSVVVGVDGSPHSDAAVEWAADYAVAHHAPLCLLHAAGDLGDNLIPFKVDAREMQAKAVCSGCPVVESCLRWALKAREPYGVWGGLSESERDDIIRGRTRKLKLPTPVVRQRSEHQR